MFYKYLQNNEIILKQNYLKQKLVDFIISNGSKIVVNNESFRTF